MIHVQRVNQISTSTLRVAAIALLIGVNTAWAQAPVELTRASEVSQVDTSASFTLRYPSSWSVAVDADETSTLLLNVAQEDLERPQTASANRLLITTERRLSPAGALARLKSIEAETVPTIQTVYLTIGGWPALQRDYLEDMPKIGIEDRHAGLEPRVRRVTIAIAVDSAVVRFEAALFSAMDRALDEVLAIGHGAVFDRPGDPAAAAKAAEALRAAPRPEPAYVPDQSGKVRATTGKQEITTGVIRESTGLVNNLANFSEIEVVVSPDGRDIIVATNARNYSVSNDGGQTFTQGTVNPAYPANGDPSLAYGQSGAFYYGFIAFPDNTGGAGNNIQACTTGITASTNNGGTFTHRGHAAVCPFSGAGVCFPDQEHIAADRSIPSGMAQDQVYNSWRNFTPSSGNPTCNNIGSGSVQTMLQCSSDGGQNWGSNRNLAGDFPRITTGQDGFVYVVTRAFGGGGQINLYKYSSCDSGLTLQPGFPSVVNAATSAVTCPVPGLDRCNDGNDLRSMTVAVDDLDASHVFVSYAINTGGNNEDVVIQDSTDGGMNWSSTVTLNSGFAARRYMPWTCAVGGEAFVGWYDRRAATPLDNSLTDFYAGSARRVDGNLVSQGEFRVSPTSDSNCQAGWPCAPRSTNDSESCTLGLQPQLAGSCGDGVANTPDSQQRCDFSDGGCPNPGPSGNPEMCLTGGGCPKYGDYNGIACAAGRLYAAYASATSPGGAQTTDIDSFLLTELVCCVPQIQIPGSVAFGEVCGTGVQTATLNVCNTGKEDLEITSIDSSAAEFAVTAPSSGFPVDISPDFCFPFEVTFTPSGSGAASATLTVNNDDPVNPTVEVDVSASVGEAAVETFIVDDGDFGDVCALDQHDLNLTIQNNGTCNLEVDSVSLSGADAADFEVPTQPLGGTIIEAGNSLLVPVRFAPDNFSDPSPRTASVDVTSSTQNGAALALDQTAIEGTVPPPDINVAIANSGDFGDVCATDQADLDLTLFNQGRCDLSISAVSSNSALFELPADTQYPLVLSPDADFNLPVRFAPDQCSFDQYEGTVTVSSDSPGEENLQIMVSGTAPCPNLVIDATLSGPMAFPATVVDTGAALGCFSERVTRIRNTGECPMTIDDISATGADFAVTEPTLFPIVLPPGEETLSVTVRFTPVDLGNPLAPDEVLGTLTVVSDDPDAAGEAELCGEGVTQSGVRILVTDVSSGSPIAIDPVERIRIRSHGVNTPSPIDLRFNDRAVQGPVPVCGNNVIWHVDQETLPSVQTTGGNPQSSYEASAKQGNLQTSQSFSLGQCDFLKFQLQLNDSDADICLLLPSGAACTNDGECCSGQCRGPAGGQTCR